MSESLKAPGSTMLPSYCDPPNPCPIGYTTADGCLEDFENSSEFSRRYQATQKCICDSEHMFDCPRQEASRGPEAIQAVVKFLKEFLTESKHTFKKGIFLLDQLFCDNTYFVHRILSRSQQNIFLIR